ncbi:MAG TPA: Crp/Fnr family transcriptional regulator [Acidimicrobiales bacterium]|nr:Crp/Fnr family transcriptional regulator [Acidimicrobiales bacterium]
MGRGGSVTEASSPLSEISAALAAIPVFADAPAHVRDEMIALGSLRAHQKGAVLFHQGDASHQVYVLVSGRVEMSSVSADGRRALHTSMLPPRLFGEVEALAAERRIADATVLAPSQVWTLDAPVFRDFVETDRSAASAVITALAQQAVSVGALVEDLRGLDLRGRLAKRLISLVTPSFDQLPPDGSTIPPLVTQADLASLANGSREQVTRILADWQRSGLVSRQGRRVTLVDVAGLARLAGLR